jgi:hypothetical protein
MLSGAAKCCRDNCSASLDRLTAILEALFVLFGGNMSVLIQSTFVLVLFVLVRCADLSISSAIARGYIRAFCYGLVALLALIYIVIALFIR